MGGGGGLGSTMLGKKGLGVGEGCRGTVDLTSTIRWLRI